MFNQSFDRESQLNMVELTGYDGQAIQRLGADAMAVKIQEVGSIKYIGLAAPGTAQSTAKWQAFKVDKTSGTVITFADGNANFDNTSTDLTSLTYS